MSIESQEWNKPPDKHDTGKPNGIEDARGEVKKAVESQPVQQETSRERVIEPAVRSYSKVALSAERAQLAHEVATTRSELRMHSQELRVRINKISEQMEQEAQSSKEAQTGLSEILSKRDKQSNSLADRITALLAEKYAAYIKHKISRTEKQLADAQVEYEQATNELIETDGSIKGLVEKIKAHYDTVEMMLNKSVKGTSRRTGAFFIHCFSNRLKELDLLLSVEPSISASTVIPGVDEEGKVSGLYYGNSPITCGVLLGDGRISSYSAYDSGSALQGNLYERRQFRASAEGGATTEEFEKNLSGWKERMDSVARVRRANVSEVSPGLGFDLSDYNEFVINAPKIAGYFGRIVENEQGGFSVDDAGNLRERLEQVHARGIPYYGMTRERRLFKILSVDNSGLLEIGKEVTPEEISNSSAGLSLIERKKIGKSLMKSYSGKYPPNSYETEALAKLFGK